MIELEPEGARQGELEVTSDVRLQQLIEDLETGRLTGRWRRPRGRPPRQSDEPGWIAWSIDKIRRHGEPDGQNGVEWRGVRLPKTKAVAEYARREGVSVRYVWRALRAARLAEEAVELEIEAAAEWEAEWEREIRGW